MRKQQGNYLSGSFRYKHTEPHKQGNHSVIKTTNLSAYVATSGCASPVKVFLSIILWPGYTTGLPYIHISIM